MILSSFLLSSSLILIGLIGFECSQVSQISKVPVLKRETDQYSLNHINAVLQGLYNLCPIRKQIFQVYDSIDYAFAEENGENPLELVFAKMYHDSENRGDITDVSIYFADSHLNEDHSAKEFYSFLMKKLFDVDDTYRNLLQWKISSVSKTTHFEEIIEDKYDILSVEHPSSSLQNWLDELLKHQREEIVTVSEGIESVKSIETFKEFSHVPIIPTFFLTGPLEIEERISLGNGKEYTLASAIVFDPDSLQYSTFVRRENGDFWFRIADESAPERVSKDEVLKTSSKSGYILAYLESFDCDGSPRPSKRLIMECLTKNTIHSISRTVKKQSSPNSTNQTVPQVKSKNMLHTAVPHVVSGPFAGSSPRNFPGHLTSATVRKQTPPPPVEFLESILVPRDLSNVQVNLIKTGSFSLPDEAVEIPKYDFSLLPSDPSTNTENVLLTLDDADDDFESFRKQKADPKDVEFDYFVEIPRQTRKSRESRDSRGSRDNLDNHKNTDNRKTTDKFSWFPQHQQQQQASLHSYNLFDGLLNFETEDQKQPEQKQQQDKSDEDEDELFMKISLAQIRKSRESSASAATAATSAANTKKSTRIQNIQSTISGGLFYRTRSNVQSHEKNESGIQNEPQQPQSKQSGRYTKF